VSGLGEHLDPAVQRHQSAFDLQVRMALGHLFLELVLELGDRRAVDLGLALRIRISIGRTRSLPISERTCSNQSYRRRWNLNFDVAQLEQQR
jgi:hypothetical protein